MSTTPKVDTTKSTALAVPLYQKFDEVENLLHGKLMERQWHIKTGVTALVAQAHHVQYGEPGVGKTFMIDLLTQLVGDTNPFRYLMTRFTTPEEVFGPISLKALEQDRLERNLDQKMVPSKITFLDEMFKANSAILNSLLTIMNEGIFFNGPNRILTRPIIFAGSNELPNKDPELAALWDRVTFRMETKRIAERSNMKTMLSQKAQRGLAAASLEPVISWAEVEEAQRQAAEVVLSDDVFDAIITLKDKLHTAGIDPTDRRFTDCIPIIKAAAWRDGRTTAEVEDMALLRFVLWVNPEDQAEVQKQCLELANPLDNEALELISEVEKLAAEVDEIIKTTDNEATRRKKGIEINGKLQRVNQNLDKLMTKVSKSKKRSDMVEEARKQLKAVVQRLLSELFDSDGADL